MFPFFFGEGARLFYCSQEFRGIQSYLGLPYLFSLILHPCWGMHSGLMLSTLDSILNRSNSGHAQCHCFVLCRTNFLLQCLSLPRCINWYHQIHCQIREVPLQYTGKKTKREYWSGILLNDITLSYKKWR